MNGYLRAAVLLSVVIGGCVMEPDFGGQEGEEYDGGDPATELDTADAEVEDSGGSDDSGGDTGPGIGTSYDWSVWSGVLTVEQGLTEAPGERDCTLSYQMQGVVSALECDGCIAVFDVMHVIDTAASVDLDACPDAYEAYSATYGIVGMDGSTAVEVLVKDGSGGFVELAEGSIEEARLQWTAGEEDVPDSSGRYRTALETADVWLR